MLRGARCGAWRIAHSILVRAVVRQTAGSGDWQLVAGHWFLVARCRMLNERLRQCASDNEIKTELDLTTGLILISLHYLQKIRVQDSWFLLELSQVNEIVTGARYERPLYNKVMHKYCH